MAKTRFLVLDDQRLRPHISNCHWSVFLVTQSFNLFWGEINPRSKPSLGKKAKLQALRGKKGAVTMHVSKGSEKAYGK